MVKIKIVWDEHARTSLKEAYHYIRKESLQQAEKFKREILNFTNQLGKHPYMFPTDKFRKDKDVRFRAFEKYGYRISYFIDEDTIRVIRFRHVKQEPKEY